MPTLLLSPRNDPDSRALGEAAHETGWEVLRMPTWGTFPPRAADAYYGESLYGRLMQQEGKLRGTLADPPEDWLPRLPWSLRRRAVHLLEVSDVAARWGHHPLFCKPVDEKTFRAGLYDDPSHLPFASIDSTEKVLVASPVVWSVEYRVFLLRGKAVASSRYARFGELDAAVDEECPEAGEVAEEAFVAAPGLPEGIVVDVGLIEGRWAVVEANQSWGSGLYDCDPRAALPAIAAGLTTTRSEATGSPPE